jgi:hypothetical protein
MLTSALVLAACGTGEEPQATATTTTAAGPPTPTAQAPPAVSPTADSNVPLVEYHSPDLGYSISHPEGWELDVEPGFADYFVWSTDDGKPLAQLVISCNENALTVDDLLNVDSAVAADTGGFDPTSIEDVEIGGTTGKQVRYTVAISGLVVEQVVAYAPGEKCGWRLALASYGSNTLSGYLPLFKRIVASFQPG